MDDGQVKIVDRMSAVEAIKRLNEEDLRFLNRLIVERLKLISQAKSTMQMARFTAGDRVRFHTSDGFPCEGVVTRLNKKTVSVDAGEDGRWNVSPSLLELVESAKEPPGLFDDLPPA